MFFKRDANAGENLYVCPAQNLWTQISGTATSLHPGTVGGILISNTAANFDVDADTMFLASQAGTMYSPAITISVAPQVCGL